VSHELRTPIARLEFGLELLDTRAKDPDLSKRVKAMEGDLRELNSLVNELLDMSKLDSARNLQAEPTALAAVLRDCMDMLPPSPHALECLLGGELGDKLGDTLGDKRGDKRGDDLGELALDRRLLARAVCNLLRNAQKYAGSRIRLAATRGEHGVEITVDDDGPGIPPEERDKIFEPFYRLDRSRDRSTGGFGLGLSIARKAVALHGGSLHAETSPLGGARFVITLPA
jgi:two-component system OmpR family sensor kinase